ncbi:MAG TPA: ABC transporter ATP-binding protein [Desulfomonilaceae bacterium]|nr:ABC transporter ATP-binding protein [Desulfomonilaceae bacterium]
MLSVNNVSVGYKGLLALQDVSFQVNKGEIVSLIGSNGAGKTTLLKTILGLLKPIKGEIRLNDKVISGRPPYDVVKMKISLVPEGRRLFSRLSVQDNLAMGAYTVDSEEQIAESMDTVLRLFPWIKERADQRAGTLSGGEQQQVAIARGLMSRPDLLMLDEPSLGVMPILITEIFRTIERITRAGVTVLLVEQNVFEALKVCHRAYVLQTGRIVMEGTGSELSQSDLVRKAYLGM